MNLQNQTLLTHAAELYRLSMVMPDRDFVYLLFKTFCSIEKMRKLGTEPPCNNKLHRSLEQNALMSKSTELETGPRKKPISVAVQENYIKCLFICKGFGTSH